MIAATEPAKQELKKILNANTDEAEACFRLTADEGGQLRLAIDMESDGDQTIEHEGLKLLVAEKEIADSLQGITMDIEGTPEGNKFVITGDTEN